ncbi:cytochrome P450 [Archangium lipolyticum]|uniref:cytochrome P450 n=1 Tax=Archangium lipolyticum TaxID=2970465 RepID=UPI00214A6560|nr:cytochrome P450 [Archangium lipolyticum]
MNSARPQAAPSEVGNSAGTVPPLPPRAGLPLVGSLPALLRDPLGFFLSAPRKHGDVYTIDLGLTRIIALNHPRHAQYVLRDNARNYGKGGPLWDTIRGLTGNGLPSSEGDFWLRQRRMMQPQFHRERINAMADLMLQAIGETMQPWEKAAETGEPFNVASALNHVTLKVVVKAILGGDISRSESERISSALAYSLDYMVRGMVLRSLPGWLPAPGRRRFEEEVRAIDDILFGIMQRRRNTQEPSGGGDILGMLLDSVDAETGERMTDQQVRDEVVSLVVAGYESTAMSLAFSFESLSRRPELMKRIQGEIDTAVGQGPLSLSHVPRLPQTLSVFQEALRLYPPSYWIMRNAVEDDVIDGFRIPAGAMVGVMACVIHRHPDFWDAPDEFDPSRFSPERSKGRHPLAWFPFGVGQRLCIGRELALLEAQFALAWALSRFDFEPIPGRETKRRISTTLRPDAVWLRLSRRSR